MDIRRMSPVWRGSARLMVVLGILLMAASAWALEVPARTGRVTVRVCGDGLRCGRGHEPDFGGGRARIPGRVGESFAHLRDSNRDRRGRDPRRFSHHWSPSITTTPCRPVTPSRR